MLNAGFLKKSKHTLIHIMMEGGGGISQLESTLVNIQRQKKESKNKHEQT